MIQRIAIAPSFRTHQHNMLKRFLSSYPPHTVITMPALSPTMEMGNIAQWKKKEGDHIMPGQSLAGIETDKAVVDFEATDEGVFFSL